MKREDPKGHMRCYVPRNFRAASLERLRTANDIIEEYEGAGMMLTLRQLYYQFVARGLLENSEESYKGLGDLIGNGRMAGLVSWTALEDRGRNLHGLSTQTSPSAAVRRTLESYRIDKWEDQPLRPEVWVEKAALEGVVGSICNELQVNFFACRGYSSLSEQWRAGMRMASYISKGQTPIVFHLGDHDPSGLDMTRDNVDKLSLFSGVNIQVARLALNMDQIEKYRPPPNPAKSEDARFSDYERKYGGQSWELDALAPDVIHSLIEEAVTRVRDVKLWDAALLRENEHRLTLEDTVHQLEKEEE